MSFSYGFYNSSNGDRKYDALEVSEIFDGLITDGVYATIGDRLHVRASGNNNQVMIGSGRAWFNHTWNNNDSDLIVNLPAAHVLYPRYDAVVIRVDSSTRTNGITYISGTAASSPTKPSMTHTTNVNTYPLCYIYRRANNNSITDSDIENAIGTDDCPYSAGLLIDTKNIAPIENNDTATRAYEIGEYILWHDELYKITSSIAKNATIIAYPTSGYNVKRTTVASELYSQLTCDTTPTSGSTRPISSGGVYTALGGRSSISTTSSVTSGSSSLITSGGVYTALGGRSSISTTSSVTSGSSSLITSGGVYTAVSDKVSKSGDTMSGNLTINLQNGTSETVGYSYVVLGNSKTSSDNGNSAGRIRLYAPNTAYRADIYPVNDLTANRAIRFPDVSGTILTTGQVSFGTSDLTPGSSALTSGFIRMVYE